MGALRILLNKLDVTYDTVHRDSCNSKLFKKNRQGKSP